jgi:hypothetical protein
LTDLARWIEARRPPAPPALRAAMLEAVAKAEPGERSVAGTGDVATAERLADAGVHALARVAAVSSGRSHALELLAADALLTLACEAALDEAVAGAASPVDPVERLLDALDMGRFAGILDGEASG